MGPGVRAGSVNLHPPGDPSSCRPLRRHGLRFSRRDGSLVATYRGPTCQAVRDKSRAEGFKQCGQVDSGGIVAARGNAPLQARPIPRRAEDRSSEPSMVLVPTVGSASRNIDLSASTSLDSLPGALGRPSSPRRSRPQFGTICGRKSRALRCTPQNCSPPILVRQPRSESRFLKIEINFL